MPLDGVVYCFLYVTGFGLLEFCWGFLCIIIGEFSIYFSFLVIYFSGFGITRILDRISWEMSFSLLIVLEMCMKNYWLFLCLVVCGIESIRSLAFCAENTFITNLISIFCIVLFKIFLFLLESILAVSVFLRTYLFYPSYLICVQLFKEGSHNSFYFYKVKIMTAFLLLILVIGIFFDKST